VYIEAGVESSHRANTRGGNLDSILLVYCQHVLPFSFLFYQNPETCSRSNVLRYTMQIIFLPTLFEISKCHIHVTCNSLKKVTEVTGSVELVW
jgi:hypothetical protein